MQIALRQAVERRQRRQQIAGEATAAGAEFDDVGDFVPQDLRGLARERAREYSAQLGRGDEIAVRAELARAGAVIAEARRVQRELHESREADPAAGCGDFSRDQIGDVSGVDRGIRVRRRQVGQMSG